MKAKELLTIITSTGYSKSTMQRVFNMAHNEKEADKISALLSESETEAELLKKLEDLEE